MLRGIAVLVLLSLAGLLAADTPVPGAKELFYDPLDASVTRLSAKTPAQSANPNVGRHRPAKAPVRVGPGGRRVVNRPSSEPGQRQKVLGVSYWVELEEPGGGPGQQVTDRRVFRSGERIRLHFRSNADGDIALIQLGSSGTARVLFPDAEQGLMDSRLKIDEDKILPSPESWFRFDANAGTERIIVLFSRDGEDLGELPIKPSMNGSETGALLQSVRHLQGSKDLLIETEATRVAEVGTYGVNTSGKPVVLEIALQHQ
jgi:hypothetical protein